MSAKKKRTSPKIETRSLSGKAKPPETFAGEDTGAVRRWEGLVGFGGAERADRWIAETVGILSRSQIKARGARVFISGKEIKLSRPLRGGESVSVEWTEEPSPTLVPEDLPLVIIHEDDRVFVIDKAQGMVTHPGHGNRRGTLANAALHLDMMRRAQKPASVQLPPARGGIVHRLDKDTSGLIVVARDAEAQAFLAAQFKDRKARKEYLAITRGAPAQDRGRIEDRLARDPGNRKRFASAASGGKIATTEYRVLARWGGRETGHGAGRAGAVNARGLAGAKGGAYALVALYPKTGRTHQLRVHMAGLGCPILGDPIYGRKDPLLAEATLMLHARRLRILLPGAEVPSLFKAKIPERFLRIVAHLDARYGRDETEGRQE
ncbi:MAG: RluA family pseudouridine synthase [Rectinema sp.]